eukprot:5763982-Pleurochrysis_carterae.AAC.1
MHVRVDVHVHSSACDCACACVRLIKTVYLVFMRTKWRAPAMLMSVTETATGKNSTAATKLRSHAR